MILQMNNSFSISRYVDKSNYKFNYSTLSSYDKTILNYLYMPSNESNIENNSNKYGINLGNVTPKGCDLISKEVNNNANRNVSKNSFFISKLLPELFNTKIENKTSKMAIPKHNDSD